MTKITMADLQAISGSRTRSKIASKGVEAFNKFADQYQINTVKRIALFLAHVNVETGGFRSVSESMNYSVEALKKTFGSHRIKRSDCERYGRTSTRRADQQAIANLVYGGAWGEKNLGNTEAGDGWFFRGMGWGQITGRAHATRIANDLGISVRDVPAILRDPVKGMEATMKLWKKWNMNAYADKDRVTESRKKWNGGSHGLKEVKQSYSRGLKRSFGLNKTVKPVVAKQNPASKILPLYRPKQSDQITRAVLDKFRKTPAGHVIQPQVDAVEILVVRGYYLNSMGKKGANDRAMYDDAIFVASPNGIQPFNGNSDPSVYRKRVATLKAPQSVSYKPGKHGLSRPDGGYPAFRQNSNVTVIRDGIGEDTDNPSKRFWINLHRGGVNGTSSLGCLTVPKHQWDEFHALVTSLLKQYGQKTFVVTLVEYAGDKPPVTLPEKPVETKIVKEVVVEKNDSQTLVVGVIGTVTTGVALFWDKISGWFTALIN